MSGDIVLSGQKADAMLKDNRRRVVTSEFEVAAAKLLFDMRMEEFEGVNAARLRYESAHPWLLDETAQVPDNLRAHEPGFEPPYRGIIARYQALCARGDRLSDQLFQAPSALQTAMVKQADFATKNGGMVSAAASMAMVIELIAAAGLEIPTEAAKDRFMVQAARIRKEFIAANPHLTVRATGG